MPVILIADDVLENVRLLKNLLQDVGQVVFARNGREALEQARRHRPDIVLLDVKMPELDGYETCRRMKAEPETRDTPVIFITGADSVHDEATGLSAGAIDYITKPFTPAIVRARVQNHLALVRANAELRQANDALRKFKGAVDSSLAAVMITDRESRIEYVNAAFVQTSGYSVEEVVGHTPAVLHSERTASPLYPELRQAIQSGSPWRGELQSLRKDGSSRWDDVAISPVPDANGTVTHFVAIISDINLRKQMEEELRGLATTDPLTGIANRRRLLDLGAQEILRAQRVGTPMSVLMLDIDHFKDINDSHGHPAGDAVIQAVARLCGDTVRAIDSVGRLGGEEFAILLPMTDRAGAQEVAERLRACVEAYRLEWEGKTIRLTVSIGVAQGTPDDGNFSALLGIADQALYKAKKEGRNRVAVS